MPTTPMCSQSRLTKAGTVTIWCTILCSSALILTATLCSTTAMISDDSFLNTTSAVAAPAPAPAPAPASPAAAAARLPAPSTALTNLVAPWEGRVPSHALLKHVSRKAKFSVLQRVQVHLSVPFCCLCSLSILDAISCCCSHLVFSRRKCFLF